MAQPTSKSPARNRRAQAIVSPYLSFLRRYSSERGCELCVGRRIDRSVLDLGTRWIFAKEVVAFPIPRRSDGSRNKTTTTIRTDVIQNTVDARAAKRALVGTDA